VANILLLPLDVASTASDYDGLPMDVIWLCVQVFMAALVILVIPFSYFYYSNYDPYSKKRPLKKAFIGTIVILILFCILCAVGYIFLGVAEVPIEVQQVQSVVNATRPPEASDCPECNFVMTSGSIYYSTRQSFPVSFILFMITVIALFGYLLFVLFAGIGLVALPQQLIQNYRWRPMPISADEWRQRKINLGMRAAALISKAKDYQRKKPWRSEFNKYKKEVLALEDEFKYTKQAHKLKGKHVLYYILCLIGGIIGVFLTLAWLVHIIIFNLFDVYPFLNNLFLALDGVVAFFGTVFFGIFGFYLLWCTIEGVVKFGLRIPFIFAIHPIKKKETYMDAWLFNAGMIQLASVGVSYFLSLSFTVYARLSANNVIYNLSVFNMRGLRYVWSPLYWVLIGLTFFSFIYFALRPVGFKKRLQHTRSKRLKNKYEMQPLNNNNNNNN
jgi:LMBR1 domain-containing protein 1